MKYTVEDISQVKKTAQIHVPASEVDAKINFMIKDLGKDLKLSGFRPGKVPASIVEGRFREQIYRETTGALVNESSAKVVKDLKVTPISEIDYDGPDSVERGKDYEFKVTFEIIPEFELPVYEGLEVEEEIVAYDEARTDETIERIRLNMAELKPLVVSRPPAKGEVAFVDFTAEDENGKPVEGFRGTGYQLAIGEGHIQDDFEEIIKKLSPGESGEGNVKLSEEINNPELAGKTIKVKASLVSLSERVLPEVNDEFAEKIGAGTVEKMRESIRNSHIENLKMTARENSQGKLLTALLEKVNYDLPESLVENRFNSIMAEFKANMKRFGKADPKDWDEPEAKIEQELREEAAKFVKGEMFLLKVAEKEKIEVAPQEIEHYLYDMANRSGLDPKQLKDYYVKNHLIYSLEDRIKTEKALSLIYNKANIKEVEVQADQEKPKAEKPKKAAPKASAKKKTEEA